MTTPGSTATAKGQDKLSNTGKGGNPTNKSGRIKPATPVKSIFGN